MSSVRAAAYTLVGVTLVAGIVAAPFFFGWSIRSKSITDLQVEVTPPDKPISIHIGGRIVGPTTVVKSIRVDHHGTTMHVGIRGTFTGMPFATDSSIFNLVLPLPAEVEDIYLCDRPDPIWHRPQT